MSESLLLGLYSLVAALASLAGGWIPLFMRPSHRGMQFVISFVAGVMLGIGFLHLLPDAVEETKSIDVAAKWTLFGFLAMFLVERFFHFHQHEPPGAGEDEDDQACDEHDHEHAHDHAHAHHDHHGSASLKGPWAWIGAAIGLTLHGLIDGIALAAGVAAESRGGVSEGWAGRGIFFAIVLHKPLDSLSIGALMLAGGKSSRLRHIVNLLYALVLPCGVLLFHVALSRFGGGEDAFIGRAVGFAAGTFLCVATSDLLPELQFHRHDRGKLSIALVLGIAAAWGLLWVEAGK